jgi:hypothetical protein
MDKEEIFNIIRFTADRRSYYPASMKRELFMDENWIPHNEIKIELGQSRYGGPVIDLPENVLIPDNLNFVGQLDLTKFSPFDKSGLLPKSGHFIIFANIRKSIGRVIYADVTNDKLIRHIREHEEDFFSGNLIDQIYMDSETFAAYDGSKKSKIFGIFTHCQYSRNEIEGITRSDKLVLLQIGENGFNDEGVFSVLINKLDLQNRRFDMCEFYWGQS